ncbi:MAG TPA: threonine synthase [Candidatus Polarisedimenticolia bacterium]|nr:threonine synthase [Candidatus Polarisedimenticolia bacterium]
MTSLANDFVDRLACSRCERERAFAPPAATLCSCGAPLLVRYRIDAVRDVLGGEAGRAAARLASRPASLWRYAEVLPAVAPITLGEGFTPLLEARHLGADLELGPLWIKDEAVNPTGSFKARGMTAAVSVAVAHGVRRVAAPSAGNAGSALAAYGARAGLEVQLFLPETTPAPFIREARRLGAAVQLVPGSIADAGRVMRETLGPPEENGWFDMSTLREPFRVEGKKTMAYEIVEQLGFRLPDVILYPTGGGTGIIGMWKAFDEMEQLGWIGSGRPRMISVQAAGCAPIVRAWERGDSTAEPWADPVTAASGLRVPRSLGDFLILAAVRDSNGAAVAVSDEEMMRAAGRIGAREGIDACPEGGACLAALQRLKDAGRVSPGETIVLFNTGTGLKYAV